MRNNMTLEQTEKLIQEWADHINAVDQVMADLHQITGGNCESRLDIAIDEMAGAYTIATAKLTGGNGEWIFYQSWLEWYRFDCDMGRSPKQAKAARWKKPRKIRTIKQLARLVWADRARKQVERI